MLLVTSPTLLAVACAYVRRSLLLLQLNALMNLCLAGRPQCVSAIRDNLCVLSRLSVHYSSRLHHSLHGSSVAHGFAGSVPDLPRVSCSFHYTLPTLPLAPSGPLPRSSVMQSHQAPLRHSLCIWPPARVYPRVTRTVRRRRADRYASLRHCTSMRTNANTRAKRSERALHSRRLRNHNLTWRVWCPEGPT